MFECHRYSETFFTNVKDYSLWFTLPMLTWVEEGTPPGHEVFFFFKWVGSPGDKHVTSTRYWQVTRYLTGRNLGMPRILRKAPDTLKMMAWLKACPNMHHRDNLSFQDRAELGSSPTYSMEIIIHPIWVWISSFTKRRYNHLESSTW